MFRLAWATDLHLSHIRIPDIGGAFGSYLAEETQADALVVTGDITTSSELPKDLKLLADGFKKPFYFVLGNHDYYGSSFWEVQTLVKSVPGWLDGTDVVSLTSEVALVGSEGWYDGLNGTAYAWGFHMNDWIQITDFRSIPGRLISPSQEYLDRLGPEEARGLKSALIETRKHLLEVCRNRSAMFVAQAEVKLRQALNAYPHVIFATHYPPFIESSWHRGRISDAKSLPWYSSKLMGDMLLRVASDYPRQHITVLCGHTHSFSEYEAAPNLKTFSGYSEYGSPTYTGVLVIDGPQVSVQINTASQRPF